MPSLCSPIDYDIAQDTVMIVSEHKSDFNFTSDTSYLTFLGNLWGVYYEDLWENWLQYNSTTLDVM